MSNFDLKKFALDRNTQVLLANFVWIVLTAAAVSIFVLGMVGLNMGLREPCAAFEAQVREFCLERQESLRQLGFGLPTYATFLTVGALVKVVPWILMGIVIFWRKPDQFLGIFFSVALILLGTTVLDEGLNAWALFYYPGLAPLITVLQFVGFACVAMWYVFPDGRFVPPWARWLALLWVLRTFGSVFLRGTLLDTDTLPKPWDIVPALFIASFMFSLGYRYYRDSDGTQRRQIKWAVAGATIYAVVYLLRVIPALHAGATVTPLQLGYVALLAASSCVFAVCLGVAMLRPQLFGRETQVSPQMSDDSPQTKDEGPRTKDEKPETMDERSQPAAKVMDQKRTENRPKTKKGKRKKR